MTLADEKLTVSPSPVSAETPASDGRLDVSAEGWGIRRFTSQEYLQMADLGFFKNQHVELMNGAITNMAPMGEPHIVTMSRLSALLHASLNLKEFWIRSQATLKLGENMPEPDFTILAGSAALKPRESLTPLLIIEVSDSTLPYDRTTKMSLYASAQVPEYWIINVEQRQVEVHTRPIPDASQPFAHRYADVKTYLSPDSLPLPLTAPPTLLPLTDFLP